MKRADGPARDRIEGLLDRLALDDGEGPALPLADDAALELVRRARERCAPAPRAKLSRLPKWPLIGIGVVVASSAAAAALGELPDWLGAWVTPSGTPASSAAATRPVRTTASKANPQRTAAAPPAFATPSALAEPTVPAVPPAPAVAPAPPDPSPIAAAPVAPRHDTARLAAPHLATEGPAARGSSKRSSRPEEPEASPEHDTPRAPAPDSPRAADLLAVANRARAERRYAAALDTYRDVITSYPETRQAQIAAVAAGELELERGNARAAEPLFQRVPRGAEVGAEALFGLSEAYRAEGRVVEERRALDRFVQLYPSNPLAAAARQRLSQLEASVNKVPPRSKRAPQ